jgi:hypothetical protein
VILRLGTFDPLATQAGSILRKGTAQLHVIELQTVLKQIVALHPSGGGDAANYNYAALNAGLAELA